MTYPTMPVLFYKSQFRQYRVKARENVFVKIKDKIYTPVQLKAVLDELMPEDVYQTISWWMKPQELGLKKIKKAGHSILSNFFLGSDYLMDFDLKNYKDNAELVSNVNLARLFLEQYGMKRLVIMKTPSGGQQVLVTDFNTWAKVNVAHPKEREYAYLFKMKKLTKMLLDAGIKWDSDVSNDTRRIFRTPNTLRLSTNQKVRLLEYSPELMVFSV